MRRTTRFLLLVAPLGAVLGLFACEGDQTGGGPPPFIPPEASTFDRLELPDTATVPDVFSDPADPLPVTVQVTRYGAPVAGKLVVFHDASGAVLGKFTTGVDGRATSTGPIPAMATVLLGGQTYRKEILTWTGVSAGDVLLASDLDEYEPAGSFAVTLPGDISDAEAHVYDVFVSECGSFADDTTIGSPVTVYLARPCLGSPPAVLGRAVNQSNNALAGFSFKKNLTAPATSGDTVSVTTEDWSAPSTVHMDIANEGSLDANIYRILVAGLGGVGFTMRDPVNAEPSGYDFEFPVGFADAMQAKMQVEPDAYTIQALITRSAPAATVAFDAASLLPAITSATADTTNIRRPVLIWAAASSLATTDGGSVKLRWSIPGEEMNRSWTIVVPPTATTVTAPSMPPEADGWLPHDEAGAPQFDDPEITFAESTAIPGYREFRAGQGLVVPNVSTPLQDNGRLLPVNATLRATRYQYQIAN